ncbi:hypothetical protein D3C83_229790 [compost metagenome]
MSMASVSSRISRISCSAVASSPANTQATIRVVSAVGITARRPDSRPSSMCCADSKW